MKADATDLHYYTLIQNQNTTILLVVANCQIFLLIKSYSLPVTHDKVFVYNFWVYAYSQDAKVVNKNHV
jgi:hypothetical protein